MRHHDGDGAAGAQTEDRARQRFIALRIEIRIRFVEHDQKRIAIKCTASAMRCA